MIMISLFSQIPVYKCYLYLIILETIVPQIIAAPLPKVVVDDRKFKSTTNESVTSLADAVPQAEEQKIFSYNNCDDAGNSLNPSQSNEQTPELPTDFQVANQTTVIANPGFFTKFFRRLIALFQGHKIDVWPRQNSQSFA
jgi:hypothetical protein